MWSRDGDILVRLAIASDGDSKGEIEHITLLLPGGAVKGRPVTLMKNDRVSVCGYLVETPYQESGQLFAERARKAELLAEVPGLAGVSLERMATCLVAESLALADRTSQNDVVLEGIVANTWERRGQLYARLAVYDEHTQTKEGSRAGKNGRPWRKAHYVSIHLPDGQVDGRKVRLEKKDRLRLHGVLCERHYTESLAMFLLRAGQIGLLANAVNADDVRQVRTSRAATYIVARSLIQFTR
jgi:hypothetical protein